MKNRNYTTLALLIPMIALAQQETKISADFRGRDCEGGLGLCDISSNSSNKNLTEITVKKISEQCVAFVFSNKNLATEIQKSIAGKSSMTFFWS